MATGWTSGAALAGAATLAGAGSAMAATGCCSATGATSGCLVAADAADLDAAEAAPALVLAAVSFLAAAAIVDKNQI